MGEEKRINFHSRLLGVNIIPYANAAVNRGTGRRGKALGYCRAEFTAGVFKGRLRVSERAGATVYYIKNQRLHLLIDSAYYMVHNIIDMRHGFSFIFSHPLHIPEEYVCTMII